jgi:hypothetical protein
MTDYHPLISRAVEGLAKNTGEARRALYERARAALVAQLRAVDPPLSESDITKERLALEEAVRKVEAEAARKALAEPRSQARTEPRPAVAVVAPAAEAAPPAPNPPDAAAAVPAAAAKPSARARILEARTSSLTQTGLKGFRNVVNEVDGLGAATAKAAQTARDTRDSYVPAVSRPRASLAEDLDAAAPILRQPIEQHFDEDDFHPAGDEPSQHHGLEPDYGVAEEPAFTDDERPGSRALRPRPSHFDEEDYEEPRPPRSFGRWIKIAVLLLIVAVAAGAAFQYRSNIAGLYQFFAHMKSSPPPAQTAAQDTNTTQPKFDGRVPQETASGQAPAQSGSPNPQAGPAVAQHAVLYEADPKDPQGKRFAGSVVWRTETVSPGPGLAPELVVRADVSIPERHMTVTWSLRRNTDKALPASHTIEVMFNLPPDFAGGGIANVPGILMKDSEEVRGMPLAGLAVKVTNGFFLIGLNAADAEMQRNVQLLKERPWFDVLIVYNNNSRAILTMEKGPPGERAFADAFKAWGQ